MARIDAAIAERAREQLGLITNEQVVALGGTTDSIRWLRHQGVLVPELPGVHRLVGAPDTPTSRLLACCLAAGPPTVASHEAAAALWHFPTVDEPPLELTTISTLRPRVRARVHRSTELPTSDCTVVGAVPATNRIRTLIDCAGAWTPRRIEHVVDTLIRDGLVAEQPLLARAHQLRARGRKGPGRIVTLLDPAVRGGPKGESWLEDAFLRVVDGAGLPTPRTQVVLVTGRRRPRVDFLFEAARLVVEVDGHTTHSTRRQRQYDADRQAGLVAAGWRVVRFTYEDVVERPWYVAKRLRQLLAA